MNDVSSRKKLANVKASLRSNSGAMYLVGPLKKMVSHEKMAKNAIMKMMRMILRKRSARGQQLGCFLNLLLLLGGNAVVRGMSEDQVRSNDQDNHPANATQECREAMEGCVTEDGLGACPEACSV